MYILVSDINMIKQTVQIKWIKVETSETQFYLIQCIYFYAIMTIRKKNFDFKLNINNGVSPWYCLLYYLCNCLPYVYRSGFWALWALWLCSPFIKYSVYAHNAFIRLSPCVRHLLTIRSSFRVLGSLLRSVCAHRSLSVHRAYIVRSLGTLQPFIVRTTRRFNSFHCHAKLGSGKTIQENVKTKRGRHIFLITKKKYLKQNECRFVWNSFKRIGSK